MTPSLSGPTMADIADPARRIVKLRDRQQCIDEEIRVLQDRHGLIEHEIAQLREGRCSPP